MIMKSVQTMVMSARLEDWGTEHEIGDLRRLGHLLNIHIFHLIILIK